MTQQSTNQAFSAPATDRRIGLLLFAVVLANYLRGVAPGLLGGDSGEFQFAAWRLGLAHATGYPLYLSMGWFWQRTLSMFGVDPAYALNLLSALFGAITVVLLYRLLVGWLPGSPAVRRLAALFAAAWLAVSPTFWNQALVAEVYTLHALLIVLILLAVQGNKRAGKQGNKKMLEESSITLSPLHLVIVSLLFGLSLTHHATALFLLPGLLWFVLRTSGHAPRNPQSAIVRLRLTNVRNLLLFLITSALPLLLYLYIPLRSGINASPWYHIQLGNETISLYQNNWQSFIDFVTGRSISVGFTDLAGVWANLPQAFTLWNIHFGWPGLVLIVLGLWALARYQRWDVLIVTVPFFVILQLFNLFYNIGDILVYYIPLYLVAAIWAAFGAAQVGGWGAGEEGGQGEEGEQGEGETKSQGFDVSSAERDKETRRQSAEDDKGQGAIDTQSSISDLRAPDSTSQSTSPLGLIILVLLFLLPLQHYRTYQTTLDLSTMTAARTTWQTILDARPAPNGVLVSNDRNEIVPLYYLQYVEGRAQTLTGLFPRLTPGDRFADIGATLETALASGQPVYLIKPMPGLEVRFDLAAATSPLVQVVGPSVVTDAAVKLEQAYGSLTLLSYEWRQQGEGVQIDLFWQVNERLATNQTTTVQVFDADGEKLGQDDRVPGGDFYPSSLWKVGETLRNRHLLRLPTGKQATKLLIGMYHGPKLTMLAAPIEVFLKKE